ncbi:elongation factor P 5-aminopentanone reductase [Fusibacter sp. 3D3]|uniref:elongation factor P 5-aminopentanone reductase n=1 Tax=Fusibacter sp. 3D3 TaxID=1048380 RepID=UPI000853B645|nr:3-oxoacyl-ACP reductase FabG [Fusibacter sp. 3D3]GAU78441.1 3-oxoacyl-[acyl-carrier protein] reductase [Fusibacter sp. 3D3]
MKNKTVIITGAAKGIGRSIAIKFAENGYNVLINYHKSEANAKALGAYLSANGFCYRLYQADVTQRAEVDQMIEYCIKAFGNIDILVNNAGVSATKLFTDISENEWDNMICVNLKSVFNCTQSVLKIMLPNKSGKIINISSIWGMVGASCEVHYSTSKSGMIGFTKALAKELGPSHIRVNCVAPGIINTDMMKDYDEEDIKLMEQQIPLGKFGETEAVAETVFFLASDGGDYWTGQVLSPNGGIVI